MSDVIINNKDNYTLFEDFYIAVVVDKNGKEGLIAQLKEKDGKLFVNPMIGGTDKDKKNILSYSEEIARRTENKVRVIKFSKRSIVKEIL